MTIELRPDYDRHDAIADAEHWNEVRQAIELVLAANKSLEQTGTLDYLPGLYEYTTIEVTPERVQSSKDYKIKRIESAVAKLKSLLMASTDDAPTPEEIALAEKPGPYDLGIGIYRDD